MSRTDELWLCLHFSQLALEVFSERDVLRPAVVIEQRTVLCSNRDNLEAGLALATANSLYADLLVLERQPQREAELLQGLAFLAYGFTPAVTFGADNSLLLEIGSCRRLYRGINPLLEQLRNALHERDHAAVFAIAHTPKAAWLLARSCRGRPPCLPSHKLCSPFYKPCSPESCAEPKRAATGGCPYEVCLQRQLDAVPVEFLQIDGNHRAALRQMGIETLGQLRALPTAALGKRFGMPLLQYLQQLWGEGADPQEFFVPAPVFRQGLTFLDGIPQRQMLLFPMKRLLQMLCDYLRARQLHCHVLRWQLFDAHQPQAEIIIELSRTQNDWQAFLELSRIKLDQITLRESVFSLSLSSDDFFATALVSQQLFPDAKDHADAGHALLDRLQARLGGDALQRVGSGGSLWPERSWRVVDALDSPVSTSPQEHHRELRPLWLLPQPQPLRECDGQPILKTALTLLRGPERVDNPWWQAENDNKNYCVRDYYVARTHDDRLCWVFSELLLPLLPADESAEEREITAAPTRHWFLHGWFA